MVWKATTLILSIATAGLMLFVARISARPNAIEPRLIGDWISDRDRTLTELEEVWGVTEGQLGGLAELLGELRITYTSSTLETDLMGEMITMPYTVLDSDANSVVLRNDSAIDPEMAILGLSTFSKIHFDGDASYWVYSEVGGIKEYFKRSDADKSAEQ